MLLYSRTTVYEIYNYRTTLLNYHILIISIIFSPPESWDVGEGDGADGVVDGKIITEGGARPHPPSRRKRNPKPKPKVRQRGEGRRTTWLI